MKKLYLFLAIVILSTHTAFAETWTTLKEKSIKLQTISINQSDTELITLFALTTYQDGVAIFYCHAGLREKEILMTVYNFVEEELINNYINVFDITSNIINDFKNEEIIYTLYFETDPLDTSGILPCSRVHLYLGSYVDKAASDILKKKGIKSTEVPEKPIPYNRMAQIMNKYKTKDTEEKPEIQQNEPVPSIETEPENKTVNNQIESENIITQTETVTSQEETSVTTTEKKKTKNNITSLSLMGGISLQLKPILDLNLKFYLNKYTFVVLQIGGTPVNTSGEKFISFPLIPQGTIGFGGCITPIESYKMNIFGYAAAGIAYSKLKGGYIKDGIYTDSSLYFMLRACAGIDFPISEYFSIGIQDCFDYLINLGFTDSISAGVTFKF